MNHQEKSKEELISELQALQQQNDFLKTAIDSEINHRIEVEKKCRQNEEKFKDIFDQPLVGISITGTDGSITANEAFCQILGYSSDEMMEQKWQDITHPDDIETGHKVMDLLFSGEKEFVRWEKRYIHKNGNIVWAALITTLRYDKNNHPQHFITTIQDITERKKAEETLKISEEKYSKVFKSSPDLIILTSLSDGRIVEVNDKVYKLSGYTQDEFIGKTTIELDIWANQKEREYYTGQLIQNGFVRDMEVQFRIKSGEIRDTLLSGEIIELQNGKYILGVIRDISEQKHARNALRENEERYRLISSVVSDYIFTSKLDENNMLSLIWVTGAFERITGFSFEEYLAVGGWRGRLHPDDIEKDNQDLEELKKNIQVISDIRTYAKNGKLVWVRVFAHPVWDYENNIITGIYGGVKDITESKIAERAIQENEHKLRLLIEHSPAAIAMFDTQMNYVVVSKRFLIDFDIKESNIIGRSHYEIFPDIPDRWKKIHQRGLAGEILKAENDLFPRANGKTDWVKWEIHPWFAEPSVIGGIILFPEVITERKLAEIKLQKANRLYSFISQINQIIVRTSEKQVLLNEVCQIAVNYGQFLMAWIGLTDEKSKTIVPAAFHGHEDGYLSSIPALSYLDIPEGRGPTGIAVRERRQVVCSDIENDPSTLPWREKALKRGYRSSIALPITSFGEVIGAFSLYAPVSGFFDDVEIALLNEVATDISFALESIVKEKKREAAEKSLLESEFRFRETLENIHLISVQISFSGELIYCNPYFCQITGYTRDEIIGKDWFTTFIPVGHIDVKEMFLKGLQSGTIRSLNENPIRIKNGSERIIRFSNTLLRNSEGEVIGTTSIGEDITERKLAEALLFESEERFRKIFEEGPLGMVMASSKTGKPFNSNKAFCDMLGYTNEELLQLTFLDFTHPEDRSKDMEGLKKLNEGQLEKYTSEKRYLKKNGEIIWATLALTKIYSEKDQSYYALAIIEDINERKLAETALRDEKDRIRTILDLVGDPIFVKDNDHRITLANQPFYDMFGMDEKSVLGHTLVEAVPENERHHFLKVDRKVLDTGVPDIQEEELTIGNLKREIITRKIRFIDESGKRFLVGSIHDITERKHAEETLRETNAYLQNLINYANAPIIVWDNEFKITRFNKAFENLSGYSSSEIIGKKVDNLFPKKKVEMSLELINRTAFGTRWETVEIEILRKDGDIRIVLWNSANILDASGNEIVATIAQGNDITERKQAEATLQESEERFRKIFEEGPMGMAMASLTSGEMYRVNKAFCNMLGYTEEELKQHNFVDLTYPDDRNQDKEAVQNLLEEKIQKHIIEKRYLKKNGDVIWAIRALTKIYSKTDQTYYALAMIEDITERKLVEETLINSEIRTRTILHGIPDLIWLKDINGVYQSCNTIFERFYGAIEADIIGKTDYDFVDRDLADYFRENDRKAIEAGKPTMNEEWVTFADDGHQALIETTKTPMYDFNGNIIGVLGVGHDITERKMIEGKIREKDIQFRKLSANVSDLIFQFTRRPDGTYCVPIASEGIRNIFGCEPEDVMEDFTPISRVIYPEDAARVISDIEYSAEHLTFFNCEFRVLIPGRPIQWILSRSTPEKLPNGSITWYGFNADITERKKAEEEIQKQFDELRRWYEVTLDREGRVLELKNEVNELLKQFGEPLRYGNNNSNTPEAE